MPSTIISLTSDASFQIKFNLLVIIVTIYITKLNLKPISEIDISNINNNSTNKASYGHDEISYKLIKRTGPALIKSLTLMVNQMLFTGIFPDSLKISKVKKLFKAGDPILISNYRPILLLPSLSKIFEHIIFRQLFDYMTMTMTMKIVYFDTRKELIINKSITKQTICAKEIPLGAGVLVIIMGPP